MHPFLRRSINKSNTSTCGLGPCTPSERSCFGTSGPVWPGGSVAQGGAVRVKPFKGSSLGTPRLRPNPQTRRCGRGGHGRWLAPLLLRMRLAAGGAARLRESPRCSHGACAWRSAGGGRSGAGGGQRWRPPWGSRPRRAPPPWASCARTGGRSSWRPRGCSSLTLTTSSGERGRRPRSAGGAAGSRRPLLGSARRLPFCCVIPEFRSVSRGFVAIFKLMLLTLAEV